MPRERFVLVSVTAIGTWQPALPAIGGLPAVRPGLSWRLLGRNNRELGRAGTTWERQPDAVAAVSLMRAELAELSTFHACAPDGLWHWRLGTSSAISARSARGYQRQRECVYSHQQFVTAAAVADLSLHDSRPSTHRLLGSSPPRTASKRAALRGLR